MVANRILISGGAGYIGSHAAYCLRQAGYVPVIVDNLSTGHEWAANGHVFERGDIGDEAFVRQVCAKHEPVAALHFAAFIEVGESVQNPAKYFENNRDRASVFFRTLGAAGVRNIVFSSTAAVYGDARGTAALTEDATLAPVNPYGQSKLDAETFLRTLDGEGGAGGGVRSVTLRYFNVAGAAPSEVGIGEAHAPETHLMPRLILPLIDAPPDILDFFGLRAGFKIYGEDYPTPDGTAVRDYIHVMDLAEAHIAALRYLLEGGATNVFNLGSGDGFSVRQIVDAVRRVLGKPAFNPGSAPRRAGDPAILVASNEKARRILGWQPARKLEDIVRDAAAWHASPRYIASVRESAASRQQ